MTRRADDLPGRDVLATDDGPLDPRVVQDLTHRGSFLRIDLQHPADDMSRLTRQEAEEAPWPLENFRLSLAAIDYTMRRV